MSNSESLPRLEQIDVSKIPRVETTGYAKKHGEFAVSNEVVINYPEEQLISE